MKNDILSKIKSVKGIKTAAILFAVGTVLIALGMFLGKSDENTKKESVQSFSYADYEKDVEERIKTIVTELGGISDVSVMITLESTSSYSYAENSSDGKNEYVTVKDKEGNESGVIISENAPGIRGVALVCSGADSPEKRLEIIKLLSALLSIPQNRVYVGRR